MIAVQLGSLVPGFSCVIELVPTLLAAGRPVEFRNRTEAVHSRRVRHWESHPVEGPGATRVEP